MTTTAIKPIKNRNPSSAFGEGNGKAPGDLKTAQHQNAKQHGGDDEKNTDESTLAPGRAADGSLRRSLCRRLGDQKPVFGNAGTQTPSRRNNNAGAVVSTRNFSHVASSIRMQVITPSSPFPSASYRGGMARSHFTAKSCTANNSARRFCPVISTSCVENVRRRISASSAESSDAVTKC
jgi:hypothetical protein